MANKLWHIVTSLFFLSYHANQLVYSSERCYGPRTPDEIARVLWENSNYTSTKRTRPNLSRLVDEDPLAKPSEAKPDIILLQMNVVSITDLNQKRGEVEMKVSFTQRWNDYRLKYASPDGCFPDNEREGFSMNEISNVWAPDIVIGNAASEALQIAGSFWVYPNGDVQYTQSLILTLSCQLDFKKLPKDTQMCKAIVSTWKDNAQSILFEFLDPPITQSESSGAGIGKSLEWNIRDLGTDVITTYGKLSKQPNSVAIFSIDIERESSYTMNFVVFPVLLIVILTWSSFFIDRGAVPARVTMSIVCFLTITNFLASELKTLPHLGRNEAWLLDFMQISMCFTFYGVVEYVFCNYMFRVEKRTRALRKLALELKQNDSLNQESFSDNEEEDYNEEHTKNVTNKDTFRAGSQNNDPTIQRISESTLHNEESTGKKVEEDMLEVDAENGFTVPAQDNVILVSNSSLEEDIFDGIQEPNSTTMSPSNANHSVKTIKQYMMAIGVNKIDWLLLKKKWYFAFSR